MSHLPTNTQIVLLAPHGDLPRGTIGSVARAPASDDDAVLVRLTDDTTHTLPRHLLTPRAHYTNPTHHAEPLSYDALRPHVILSSIIGSHAYGLASPDSDVDRRGCFLPPADLHWTFAGTPDSIADPHDDTLFWELQRFLELALKANALALESLFSPIVEHATPLGQELLDLRHAFLSRLAYHSYTGYALSTWRSLKRTHARDPDATPWKHAMHLIRLLLAARHLLRHATLPVTLDPPQRQHLLAIRAGEHTLQHIEDTRAALLADIEDARPRSPLPERPDTNAVEAFLLRARRAAL